MSRKWPRRQSSTSIRDRAVSSAANTRRPVLRQIGRLSAALALATTCAAAWTVQPARAGGPAVALSPSSVSVAAGQSFTLTATVTASDGTPLTGDVDFCSAGTASCGSDPSQVLATAPLSATGPGQATASTTFTAGSGTPSGFVAGWNYLMFGFLSTFAVSDPASVTVGSSGPSKLSTSISLSGDQNIQSNQSATFTAAVSNGTGTPPTGTVQFYDNGLTLGSSTLAGGSASFTAGGFTANVSHTITAAYMGDADNLGSTTSGGVSLTVSSPPSSVDTTISASVSPARLGYGGSATLSAHVVQTGTSVAPTNGSVTFWNGSDSIASGQIDGNGNVTITKGGWTPGHYTIRASYVGSRYNPASASFTVAVAALLHVQAPSATTVYGNSPPAFAPSYSGFLSGDGASSLATAPTCGTAATSASDTGTYPITCGGGSDPNYDFAYADGTLTVDKRDLVFSPQDVTVPAGTGPSASLGVAFSGFVDGDTPAVVTGSPDCRTDATSTSPAGTYTYTCDVGTMTALDYNLVPSGTTGTLTLTARALTVTAPSPQVTYGAGPPSVLAPQYSGFVGGDGVGSLAAPATCTTTATASSPVGTYPVTCMRAVAKPGDPYSIAYVDGTLTVLPAPLIVTPNDASMTQGDALPPLTATIAGFADGETLATSGVTGSPDCTTTTDGSSAGTFPISCTVGTLQATNYRFVMSTGTATLTVQARGASPTKVFNWTTGPVVVGQPVKLSGSLLAWKPILGVWLWWPAGSQTITLSLGSQSCQAVTDQFGSASCTVTPQGPTGWTTAGATFAGNQWYAPSTYTVPILLYAFPGGGAFLIGDLDNVLDSTVTFWGAQWAKTNSLSGGPAPSSCKGYASSVSGSGWSTDPGNSSSPPGSLPSYMGVIVTDSAQKHGSQISGSVDRVVVVHTNPGYESNPGHAGTGTIVANDF